MQWQSNAIKHAKLSSFSNAVTSLVLFSELKSFLIFLRIHLRHSVECKITIMRANTSNLMVFSFALNAFRVAVVAVSLKCREKCEKFQLFGSSALSLFFVELPKGENYTEIRYISQVRIRTHTCQRRYNKLNIFSSHQTHLFNENDVIYCNKCILLIFERRAVASTFYCHYYYYLSVCVYNVCGRSFVCLCLCVHACQVNGTLSMSMCVCVRCLVLEHLSYCYCSVIVSELMEHARALMNCWFLHFLFIIFRISLFSLYLS